MRVLIAGGSGLIGRALCVHLVARGHRVQVLSRNPARAVTRLPHEVEVLPWDGRAAGAWVSAIERSDAVVNLAGASIGGESPTDILTQRWNAAYKRRIRESRVQAGQALVTAIRAARHRPAVLVQASAVGYYGSTTEIVDETAPPGTDFLANVCRAWEASTADVEAWGVRRVVIRTGLVLAAQGGILPVMLLPVRLFVGGPVGSGEQGISWIHLHDEVAAIRFLMETPDAHGVFNLTAPQPVSNARFLRQAARRLHRPFGLPAPAFALRWLLGEKAMLVLEGQYVHPRRLLAAGFDFCFPDLESALQDLLG